MIASLLLVMHMDWFLDKSVLFPSRIIFDAYNVVSITDCI